MGRHRVTRACLIPARGRSKRFPGKNIAPLKGRPLLEYSLDAADRCGLFDRIWVSTEDEAIASVAKRCGAFIHHRPPTLADDRATVVDVCLDFCDWLLKSEPAPEVLCVVSATAALLEPEDLTGAWNMLERTSADVVMGTTSFYEKPFWALYESNGTLKPYFGEKFLKKSQDLPQVCVDSGYFYFARVPALQEEKTFYSRKLVGYPIPRERSVDIDEPVHLKIAEALMGLRKREYSSGRIR